MGEDEQMSENFVAETTSVSVSPQIRQVDVTDRWNTGFGAPNGGYALALMLRGAMDEFDVGRPSVLAISYLSSPKPGVTARIEYSLVKAGNRVQTVEATMSQEGKPVLHLVANFLRNHTGVSQELGQPPSMPAPEECLDPKSSGMTPAGLFDRLDHRWPAVPGWALGQPSGDASVSTWIRLAEAQTIDWPALALLCDASPPPVMELGQHMSMTVQLTVHLHRLPEPGAWVASHMSTKHVVDGMHEEDGELWDEHGNLLAQSRQMAILLS